jgi:hypothetical protein
MANITFNRIDTLISDTDITAIKADIQHISSLIPRYGLTPDERKSFRGMNVDNKAFTEDCIMQLRANGAETMPPYIKTDDLIADFALFEQLDLLKSMLNQVASQVETAQRIAGKEAYDTALKVYKLYEAAAEAGVPGSKTAFEQLNQRFKKGTGRKADINSKGK